MSQIMDYVQLAFTLVGLFSAIAAVTPNKWDDEYAQKARDFLDLLGMNFWNAKNQK